MSAHCNKPSAYALTPKYSKEELEAREAAEVQDEQLNSSNSSAEESDPEAVFDEFCSCGCCYDFVGIPSDIERRCCASQDFSAAYFENFAAGECILSTREINIILSPEHLQLSWYQQRQYQGYTGRALSFDYMSHKNYRYHAYRSYVQYLHGRLGRRNRRVIPACVVAKIRSLWPSEDGTYVGFRDVDDEEEPVDEIRDALYIPDE